MMLRAAQDISDLIRAKGPCTGFEIKKEIRRDGFLVWKACKSSKELVVRALGRRYMRLDRHVEGFARLSPSILREFYTYSVVGLAAEPEPLEKRCGEVIGRIGEISRYKFDLSRHMVSEIMEGAGDEAPGGHQACFILAGDIVHGMAHDVPRPERSTGKLVKGSDIDLVVVVEDDVPDSSIKKLDEAIYAKKHRMLIDPSVNEEVDYIIKRLSTVRRQARFDDFRKMVAMKILQEGVLVSGSEPLFAAAKNVLRENGLVEKLDALERKAEASRSIGETVLLDGCLDKEAIRKMHLFYSADEFEEFE